jgi:mRNA interferase HigB
MRVIKRKTLVEFWTKHPNARNSLVEWYDKTRKAAWTKFTDVKSTFGQTDQTTVDSGHLVCVFDIGGNKFRLIAAIHYNTGTVFVLRILTHPGYDSEK